MSLRLEMLQVARLAPILLGESKELVRTFLNSQQTGGGFADRAGCPDLYYTVFGLEALLALSADLPLESSAAYLRTFGSGETLDLVHLCCLIRCWANIARMPPAGLSAGLAKGLERFRTADGGYRSTDAAESGNIYSCFLALGAYQDLRVEMPRPDDMLQCVADLRAGDGGYGNRRASPQGLTSPTAAAIAIFRQFGERAPVETADWLQARQHADGGFFASPSAPLPDLLSTATALHALSGMQVPLPPLRDSALDFLDSLWSSRGGFLGHWADDTLDCEYTYYGLLALGHLSL